MYNIFISSSRLPPNLDTTCNLQGRHMTVRPAKGDYKTSQPIRIQIWPFSYLIASCHFSSQASSSPFYFLPPRNFQQFPPLSVPFPSSFPVRYPSFFDLYESWNTAILSRSCDAKLNISIKRGGTVSPGKAKGEDYRGLIIIAYLNR